MKKIVLPILMMMILGLVGIVVYGATMTYPTSGTLYGTIVINVTNTTYPKLQNCTVTGSSTLSGDTLSTTVYNQTAYTFLNGTLNTHEGIDATDWIFTGTCYNLTGGVSETITSITSLTIDNGAPTCSQSTLSSNTVYDLEVTPVLTATCTNATSATVKFGTNSWTMNESGDVCTYDMTSVPHGTYDITITSSDGTNTTDCTQVTSVTLSAKTGSSSGSAILAKSLIENPEKFGSGVSLSVAGTQAKVKAWFDKEMQPMELTKTLGLAVVGGIVGFFVIPVIGTVPGAVIGGLIGLLL